MTVWSSHLASLVGVIFPALVTHGILVVVVAAAPSCLLLVAITCGTSRLLVTVTSCTWAEKSQQLPEV